MGSANLGEAMSKAGDLVEALGRVYSEIEQMRTDFQRAHPRYASPSSRRPEKTTSGEYKRGYAHGYDDALNEFLGVVKSDYDYAD